MSFLANAFGPPCSIDIEFADSASRSTVTKVIDGKDTTVFLFDGREAVSGNIHLNVKSGKKVEHAGITVQLLGQIEMFYDRGNQHEFIAQTRRLEDPGVLSSTQTYPFSFDNQDMNYESYVGMNVQLRYCIRVQIVRNFSSNIVREEDFWVINNQNKPEVNSSIKMEVGIEDCLHIEFEYGRSKYHLEDVILGKVYFLLVRIKIKHMEIEIRRRETTGSGSNMYNESEALTKFEIMDGAPVRGESIPIRLFLSGFDLTPSYRSVANKFSVKYYLNLVLVDEEDRRYFKQQEITLWRRPGQYPKGTKLAAGAGGESQ